MLHYSLYKNNLVTADPNDWLARPADVKKNTRADLIREITGPGSILKPTETEAVIDSYWHTIIRYIRRGEGYSDKYVSIRYSFRGDFKGQEDEFDPERHELVVYSSLMDDVTEAAAEIPLRKVEGKRIVPEIERIYDWNSDTHDDRLTPGGGLEIRGSHLKIRDNLEEEEGVFFINREDGSQVRATQLRSNKPKTLSLRIPNELTAGRYRLEVRNTRYKGKTLRTGRFDPVLTVE